MKGRGRGGDLSLTALARIKLREGRKEGRKRDTTERK
jgi:hypothetical protein